jgi:MFS family permease
MKFGERIVALQHGPWVPFYLKYDELKTLLDQIVQQEVSDEEQQQLIPSSPARYHRLLKFHRFSHDEPPGSTMFLIQLNQQVETIVMFFLQEQGRIAYQLAEYRQEQALLTSQSSPKLFHSLRLKYHSTGAHVLHLIQFVEVNVTGVRKILKKHDKLTHWAASGLYLGGNRRSSYMLKPLLQDTLTAICVTLETAIAELNQQEEIAKETHDAKKRLDGLPPRPTHVRSKTEPFAHHGNRHRRVLSHAEYFHQDTPPTDAVLAQIYAARRRLQQTSEYANFLAKTVMLDRVHDDDEDDEVVSVDSLANNTLRPRPGWLSNQLNLMSTFLYMANYYIVAPTSGNYAAKLGSTAGLAAIIIGMTPIAALVSTLLYSWWTSYSYKSALVFASCCSLLGNVFYAMGLPFDSLTLVLVGRLLNGFGSARSINRRYIADSYSHAERTAASAAFVTAGALGMAAGPALSAVLNVAIGSGVSLWWQDENSPGWFMFGVWTIYLVMLIYYFEDPPKRMEPVIPSQVEVLREGVGGEKQPLLLSNGNSEDTQQQPAPPLPTEPPLWQNIPVMITFGIYFVLKLVLECVLSSSGTLTEFYFNWSAGGSGMFLAALGASMLPANWCVAWMARSYDDRELIMMFQVMMTIGCIIIFDFRAHYPVAQYVAGSVILFLSSNALEGPNMSLLSKTIPSSWSKGFFNVGLLATEAGTLGRAVGDVFLAYCGANGAESMLNTTFAALAAISFLSLFVSYRCFDSLQPALRNKD